MAEIRSASVRGHNRRLGRWHCHRLCQASPWADNNERFLKCATVATTATVAVVALNPLLAGKSTQPSGLHMAQFDGVPGTLGIREG